MKSVLAPVNAVLLTRRDIEEVVDDAVRRGRMTRDDAQQMVQTLLQYGARQTDDFLSDLERLLGRGAGSKSAPSRTRAREATGAAARAPAGDRTCRSPATTSCPPPRSRSSSTGSRRRELRKLRDYERRHANRKTVLDPIERKLR